MITGVGPLRNLLLRPLEVAFFRLCLTQPERAMKVAPLYARVAARLDPVGALSLWADRRELCDFQAAEFSSYKAARWADADRFKIAASYAQQADICDVICRRLAPVVDARWDRIESWCGRARFEIQARRRARHYDEMVARQPAAAADDDELPF